MKDKSFQKSLTSALNKMFGKEITYADYEETRLHGGTVGDIRLISGIAITRGGEKLPYKIVLKIQKKWERYGDPVSWRREYDLYVSEIDELFDTFLRRPECYYAEMNDDETETRLWIEYIDGISGNDLTVEMFECAAYELGRFQGRLYANEPIKLKNLENLSSVGGLKEYYLYFRSWEKLHDYIRSEKIPKHLREMLIETDNKADEIWHRLEKLPVVFCHRDFWVTNIFYKDGKIVLIDWDTSGWGYMGEDIKSLIADESDVEHMVEYYRKCIPAYYKGFSEFFDVANITDNCIFEMIIVNIGFRLAEWHMNAETEQEKALQIESLQKIYEMGNL